MGSSDLLASSARSAEANELDGAASMANLASVLRRNQNSVPDESPLDSSTQLKANLVVKILNFEGMGTTKFSARKSKIRWAVLTGASILLFKEQGAEGSEEVRNKLSLFFC
jgi:hypothetical protein